MEKPWWLRLIGLVALLLALVLGVGIGVFPRFFLKPQMVPVVVAASAVTLLLALGWVLIAGMLWVANRSVKAQAAITFEVLADSFNNIQSAPASVPEPSRGVWDNPPTGIICDDCRRPHAMLYCRKHKMTLCFLCTGKHDSEDCAYIAADRHAPPMQQQTVEKKKIGRILGI